jgi:mannose-6-phosphate isomerase
MIDSLTFTGEKEEILGVIKTKMETAGFKISSSDFARPWGGFLVIDESQTEKFCKQYFPEIEISTLSGKLSPKILFVEAHKRLSWQYHNRRSEIWKLIAGQAGVVTSTTNEEGPFQKLIANEIIRLKKGERHRLVGLNGWGMVAEIWQHTDSSNPSDENDIIRIQDDFGR